MANEKEKPPKFLTKRETKNATRTRLLIEIRRLREALEAENAETERVKALLDAEKRR